MRKPVVVFLLACAACSDSRSPSNPSPSAVTALREVDLPWSCPAQRQPAQHGTGSVNADGGRRRFRAGGSTVDIEIPPGAVSEGIALDVREATGAPAGHLGPAFEISPHGTKFSKPVSLRTSIPRLVGSTVSDHRLHWATVVGGRWTKLPTSISSGHTLEGATTHFSTFGLIADCHDAGTKTTFALTDCPAFSPTFTLSRAATLDVMAGRMTMVLRFSAGAGTVQVRVAGLVAGHIYYLYEDTYAHLLSLTADATGAVTFSQDINSAHLVLLQTEHASISLTSASCVAPFGTFDSTTRTCSLTADVNDSISIDESAFTLDCAGHTIGSSTRMTSAALFTFDRSDVGIRNCVLLNHDLALVSGSMTRFTVRHLSASIGPGLAEGSEGPSTASSTNVTVEDLDVSGYRSGFSSYSDTDLVLRDIRADASTGAAISLVSPTRAKLEGLHADGSRAPVPQPPNYDRSACVLCLMDATALHAKTVSVTGARNFGAGVYLSGDTWLEGATVRCPARQLMSAAPGLSSLHTFPPDSRSPQPGEGRRDEEEVRT